MTMNRRAAIVGALTSSAALAVPVAVSQAVAQSALPSLIAAHAKADAAYLAASQVRDKLEDTVRLDLPLIPLMLLPDGTRGGNYAVELHPSEDCAADVEKQIRENHESYRRKLCSPVALAMSPQYCADIERGIEASLARCLAALSDGVADLKRQDAESGVAVANLRAEETFAEVNRLSVAILGHVPTTTADAAMKARWITTDHHSRGTYFNEQELPALIALIAGKAVA